MTMAELERRMAAIEERVRLLQDELTRRGEPIDKSDPRWVLANAGRFAGDPDFAEIVRLGREWRESQRPGRKRKVTATTKSRKKSSHAHP